MQLFNSDTVTGFRNNDLETKGYDQDGKEVYLFGKIEITVTSNQVSDKAWNTFKDSFSTLMQEYVDVS